ncbi:DUF7144 family membrane protein [Nonomuraea soli]|uniref:Vacuolar-type H+-ATPase subunit I/STV1 n=1 Tax=Nonomuraea soli TaxID=1032476 RepID=A0A7W0CIS2_9ACTN|nr:hypothetical protein [Nonomuraea soli]MBA2891964.1 vacuolar-type H+-ATPase subunit I/STV1 [Nonomuraea soli]
MAKVTGWVGWIWFAGMMIIMAGLFNLVSGLYAIIDDELYVTTRKGLLLFDLTGWGWVHLILGVLLVITGIAVSIGKNWARLIAVILVMLNALTQLTWIMVNPWWSLVVIAIDVLVLYALIVHGKEAESMREY